MSHLQQIQNAHVRSSTPIQTSSDIENHVLQNTTGTPISIIRSEHLVHHHHHQDVESEKWSSCYCDRPETRRLQTHDPVPAVFQSHQQVPVRPISVDTNLFQTDVPSVKAADICEKHWAFLNRHIGNKRKCTICKKKGIVQYRGELFLPEGAVEINSCVTCGRTFGQVSKSLQQKIEEKSKVAILTPIVTPRVEHVTPHAPATKHRSWFTKFNY